MLSVYRSIFFSNLSSACIPPLHPPLHPPFFVFIDFLEDPKSSRLLFWIKISPGKNLLQGAQGEGRLLQAHLLKRRSSREKQPAAQPRFHQHLRETLQCFRRHQLFCIEFAFFCRVLSMFCSLQRFGPRFQCLGSTLIFRVGGRKEQKKQEKQESKVGDSKPADTKMQRHPKRTILTSFFLPQSISLLFKKKKKPWRR